MSFAMAVRGGERRISGCVEKRIGRDAVRIVVTNKQYGELCRGSIRRLPSSSRSRLDLLTFQNWNEVSIPPAPRRTAPTIFVSRLADIAVEAGRKSRGVGRPKHLLFSEGMPIEAVASRLPRLDVRDASRVHVARKTDVGAIAEIMYRLFRALAQPRDAHSIVDAWVEGDELVLLSPSFERLSVPLGKLAAVTGKSKKEVTVFEIDTDGRFLFWPRSDLHLGWDQVEQIVDPAKAVAAEEKTRDFNHKYGLAIRGLREEKKLTQSAIGGLTERHLRRIEQGKQPVTSSALRALAKAHGMAVEEYLKQLARRIEKGCITTPARSR